MNVPLLICAPDYLTEGRRIDTPVSLIDLLPTLADLLAFEDRGERDGVSLLPLLQGAELQARPLFAQRKKPNHEPAVWAVVDDGWKLIYWEEQNRFELYDAVNDPLDQQDLASRHPDQVQRLRSLLEPMRQVQPMANDDIEVQMDEAMVEHLQDMGYAGGEDDE